MNEYWGGGWGQGEGGNQNRTSTPAKENENINERSKKMYESEEYKIECWRAAAYGVRLLANALPVAVTVAALAFLIQSVLSQPFTLSCKSEPMQAVAKAVVIEPTGEAATDEEKSAMAPKAEPSTVFQSKEPY